jgi:tetratricopeptide (TPR) repeat protein
MIMTQFHTHKFRVSLWPVAMGLLLAASVGLPPAFAQTASERAGYDYLERGWVDDAIRQFQQAVQQQPEAVSAQLGLAIAYQRAGQDADAWQTYQRVLALSPQNREALIAMGTFGGYRPEWQAQGIAALTTLLTLEPNNLEARAQRALLLGYQGRFEAAIADYERVLAHNPSPQTLVQAAQIYTYSGNYPQGQALFTRYLQQGQTLTDGAAIAYAQALSGTGRTDAAITLLTPRHQAQPDDSELRAALALAYASDGQPARALELLQPLANNPEATLSRARVLSQIGRQTEDTEMYREAIALYQAALEATPNPSQGFQVEVADVLSEDPAYQAEALQLYDTVLADTPEAIALQTKRLILAHTLGQVSDTELTQTLLDQLQPLPAAAATQQQIGQALVPLENPDPALLPIYADLISAGTPVDFIYFRFAQIQIARQNWLAAREAIAAYQDTPTGQRGFESALLLAEVERREGNLEASAELYDTISRQANSLRIQEAALLGLSGIRQSQQRWEAALMAYERLINLKPNSDRAQLGAAYLALKLQQMSPEQATTVLDTWLANYPTIPEAMVPPELLNLVGELPPTPDRLELYETLLAIDPVHIGLNRRYAQTLAAVDRPAALAYLETLTPTDPDDLDLYFVQGEVAQTLGELDLASQAYETILEQVPDQVDALAALAGVRFQQGRLDEAETLYETVLALRPNDWQTRYTLAELQLAQDEPLAAIAQFQDLADQASEPSDSQAIAHRLQEIQLNFLRRRGFQPQWEQY